MSSWIARIACGATIAVATAAAPGTGSSQTDVSPPAEAPPSHTAGQDIAGKLCSGCHFVQGRSTAGVPAGISSMQGIANKAGQTGQKIHNVLIMPHPPMPDIRLTNHEIFSIILYLETLRTNENVKPLIAPREQGTQPVYPEKT